MTVKKNQLEQRLGKIEHFFLFSYVEPSQGFERTGISSSSSSSSFLHDKKYELEVKLEVKYTVVKRVEL